VLGGGGGRGKEVVELDLPEEISNKIMRKQDIP